ncbi:MAG: hypothetical protein HQL21_05855, partial [Candidatus Omnitrophica bacterium]|nr:hypothetical protein [Candidatus Omnitrophota bacterium]
FWAGTWGLKIQKEQYWSETIVEQPAYQALSAREQELARIQFMNSGSLRMGDAPLRYGGIAIRLMYALEVVGSWLKDFWLIMYGVVACYRLAGYVREAPVDEEPTSKLSVAQELRVMVLYFLAAIVWYTCWSLLIPSAYVVYHRVYLKSFDYLWNARLIEFDQMAKAWPYFFALYVISVFVRGCRHMLAAGKAR